jgi:hypothetical protein
MQMKKIMIIALVAMDVLVAHAALVVDLSGDWSTGTARPAATLPTLTTTADTKFYYNGFATAYLTNGQASTGGNYVGPTMYASWRQYNVGGISGANTLRVDGDTLSNTAGASSNLNAAGTFNFMYMVKKANFGNGLSTSNNIGFDATSDFSIVATTWSGDSKSLRAVVQNGSIWYISQAENTAIQSGTKTLANAASLRWSVWDPTTSAGFSGDSLDFTTTVAGSTFTDIQAVGVWARIVDGAQNANASISTIQIGAVGVVPSGSCNLVFVNSTPSQFIQNPSITTNLSFVVRNTGTDATNVTVSLTGNYSWLTASTVTNSISLLGNGSSVTNIFSVTIASNALGGVYADAFTLKMQGAGTDAVTSNFSSQVSLTVLNTAFASMTKTAFAADTNETDTATLTVSNNASWELSFVLTNGPAAAWLSYPSGTLTLPANTSTGITITANGSLAGGRGIYSNVLSATWNNNTSGPNPTNFSIQFDVRANPLASLAVNLGGNWNTSSSGNMNYTRPPVTTNGTAIFYDNDFSTAILTNGQPGVGGSYQGQNIYGAFRQQNDAGAPADIATLRSGSGDYLEFGANTVPTNGAGEFDFMYVFKKADFYNGLNTGNIGFDSNSVFNISVSIWGADAKVLRAVVQNGSTWYISQASNTVAQAGAKVIMTNAYDARWAIWDPTADILAASLSFATTVAGSTFADIQAVGVWGAFTDGTVNPSARIETIQIGAITGASATTNFLLTGSVTGGNGSVSPVNASVPAGSSQSFVVTASNYYRIASLTTNGTPVVITLDNNSTSTNFLWSNVQAAGALVVTFTNQVASSGTPYEWLALYGLTNGGATFDLAAVADTDTDGLQAWQEYIAGTVPTNSASTLRVVENPRNVLNWSTVSGRVYSVYWSTNLVSGFQALNTSVPYPQRSYTNTSPDSRVNYYQVKVRVQ